MTHEDMLDELMSGKIAILVDNIDHYNSCIDLLIYAGFVPCTRRNFINEVIIFLEDKRINWATEQSYRFHNDFMVKIKYEDAISSLMAISYHFKKYKNYCL